MSAFIHKDTRSLTSRAKLSSCVTTTIVMPSEPGAHHGQDFADKLGRARSRFVEKHQTWAHGEGSRDRDTLLLTPESSAGYALALFANRPAPKRHGASLASTGFCLKPESDFCDVFPARSYAKKIESLKTMPVARRCLAISFSLSG